MIKVRAHTCYLGTTGYAAHARSFFRALSKFVDLRVRNYTWDTELDYINDTDLQILDLITLTGENGVRTNWPIKSVFEGFNWANHEGEFVQDIDIVLMEERHYYFYDPYDSPIKIAYTVWESTRIKDDFFQKLLTFDYLWVVSQWHKDVAVNQGYPPERVFVVPEGVDWDTFTDNGRDASHLAELTPDQFNFLFFGRWDYRKSPKEIIRAFLDAFPTENVNLILSAHNPFSIDGFETTEQRLQHYGLVDSRIKIKKFPPRADYLSYIKGGNVLLTCARSEGWNIPLIEALAAGTPVIYSNWGAQLEFARGLGTPVNIVGEFPSSLGEGSTYMVDSLVGNFCEPDFEDLVLKMRDCYNNWHGKKEKALRDAEFIRENFNWDKIGKLGACAIEKIYKEHIDNVTFNIHFIDGPFVEVVGKTRHNFRVEFIDALDGSIPFQSEIGANMWARANRRYYTDWLIRITNTTTGQVIDHKFSLEGKRVLISINSSSLGDTIAWLPPVYEFAKIHKCHVIVSTFRNGLFAQYPDIEFVEPGSIVENLYASYAIGWFYNGDERDFDKNPTDFRQNPLQKTACDILGIEYKPVRPLLNIEDGSRPQEKPYVCLGIHSTAQAKYWNNPTGWQEITDYWLAKGRDVIVVSSEGEGYMGNRYPIGAVEIPNRSIQSAMRWIKNSEIFIGVSSGLSWLSWALGTKTVIISGFSNPISEVQDTNIIRIFNKEVCNSCFNRHKLDGGNWNWCPDQAGTERMFECTKSIGASDVIEAIETDQILSQGLKNSESLIKMWKTYRQFNDPEETSKAILTQLGIENTGENIEAMTNMFFIGKLAK
jgi:autotransporter strand-loop-strand O-heptosyltransferase